MNTMTTLFKGNLEWGDTGQRIGAGIISGLKSCQTVFVTIDFSPVGSVHPPFYLIPILSSKSYTMDSIHQENLISYLLKLVSQKI